MSEHLKITVGADEALASIREQIDALGTRTARRVLKKSAQRAATRGRVVAIKYIKERYDLASVSILPKNIKAIGTTRGKASVRSVGRPLGLWHFRTKPKNTSDTTGSNRTLIRARVLKSDQFKEVERGFFWKGSLLQRRDAPRVPLDRVEGPAFPQMLGDSAIVEQVQNEMLDSFYKNAKHELEYRLSKVKK